MNLRGDVTLLPQKNPRLLRGSAWRFSEDATMKHGCERARTEHGHLLFLGSALAFACHTVAMRRVGLDGLHAAAFSAVRATLVYMPPYAIAAGASGPGQPP